MKFTELMRDSTEKNCHQADRDNNISKNKSDSTKADESKAPKTPTTSLNTEGLIFYYRQFVRNFLDEIKYKEHTSEQTTNFHINLLLSQYQLSKLHQFAVSQDLVKSSGTIQDVTEILTNMFSHVEYFKPEEFSESISKAVLSIAMDPRIQIALCLIILVMVLSSWLFRQICRHGFSVWSLVVTLLTLIFVISVINNHILLTQVFFQVFFEPTLILVVLYF